MHLTSLRFALGLALDILYFTIFACWEISQLMFFFHIIELLHISVTVSLSFDRQNTFFFKSHLNQMI